MKTLYGLLIVFALLSTVVMTAEVQAECKVATTAPTYDEGKIVQQGCDTEGNTKVTLSGVGGGGLGTATAAAPTLTEGAAASFRFDLSNNAMVSLGTLISCEDQTNNLCMTSGGVVRQTQILGTGGVPSTATDATSTPQIIPTGRKTFTGRVTCTGTCVQTQAIYGTWRSTADATKDTLVCTIYLNASTSDQASCAPTETNFSYWYVVTTATSGTTPLAGIFAQY